MFRRLLLSLSLLVVFTSAIAQTGSINGQITDAATGEAVVGANVIIQGTSVGSTTDIEGKFNIPNVKPGTYTLAISFITYKAHIVPDVVVESAKISTVNVAMVEDSQQLTEIVVTGMRETNTDLAMISSIRESKLVVSGISAEQISRSQDRDAAQVVRRVPGVTIQDNRFVIVRGLSSRYSNVMLNGVTAPSTEADSRAFSFDIIPSGLLDRMLIYKSGAAELPGDFAGSVIQINTKSAVDNNFTNVSVGGGYRVNTTFTKQLTQQRSSTEWLGFDNGFRSLPKNAPADYRALGTNVALIEAESRKFKNTWGLEEINVKPDVRLSADMGRSFNIGNVTVNTINAINYSNTNQFNEIEFSRYFNYESDGNDDFIGESSFEYKDSQLTNNVRIGLLSNWTVQYSDKSKIEFRNLYNRLGTTQTTIRNGDNFLRQQNYRNYSSRYIERGVYSGQLEGKHTLREDKSKITWLVGYTSAARNEPDWKRLVTARNLGSGDEVPYTVVIPSSTSSTNASRFYQNLDEYSLTNRLDFEYKFGSAENEKEAYELKAGYWLEYKDRSFKAREIGHVVRDGFDPAISSLSYDVIFDPQYVAYNGGHHISENSNITDSYTASNTLAAGYVGITMPISEKFRIIPGIRVEHNIQKLETAPGVGSAEVERPVTSILPFLNVSYNLNTTSLVRLAYSRTINRPEFRELAPFNFYDFDNQADVIGNPDLKIANIHNIDLRWEYYPTPNEFISAGVFYKYFNNPIETNIKPGSDNPVFFFNNADKAQNYGAEVEVRKALAYSSPSRFLNNTSVVFNAAYIISKIDLVNDGTLREKDSRPMQGQSPYIVNASLFYNDDESGIQANLQYNIFGKRIAFVGIAADFPTWWEMPRHVLDLTFSKRLTRHADVRFGVSNLLNAREYIREDANGDNNLSDQSRNRDVRSTQSGQYITLGVALKW